MEKDKKEFGSWWLFITGLVIVSSILFTILHYVGFVGSTVIERKVFEQSYQKQAGDSSRQRHYQAQLADINSRLVSSPNDADLLAQRAMLRIQIKGNIK
jgi:5-bromo-4-chloroindolyl phosphate hydrolysis protein